MIKTFALSALFVCITLQQHAQNSINFENFRNYFDSPLDIPLYLSANFGELRETHFHAGLDFKTQGAIGKKIYVAAEGYVSRIKVQTQGYGRALYVNHPNGLTTVYAHCDRFSDEIETVLKRYQYKNKTHVADIYLKANEIPVERREVIAISGNTGGSGGPHLHFEIRESASQEALNGLKFNFDIRDDIPPKFTRLCVYPMNEQSAVNGISDKFCANVIFRDSVYIVDQSISAYGLIAFGTEGYDYLNYSNNRCALYGLRLYDNNHLIYSYNINGIDFSETSCVRSHIDYEERIKNRDRVQKSYIEPNNALRIYNRVDKNGVISVTDTSHTIKYTAEDAYGNTSELIFKVTASGKYIPDTNKTKNNFVKVFYYDRENVYENAYCKVLTPQNALYDNVEFEFAQLPSKESLSDIFYIHNEYTPLDKKYTLGIKAPDINNDLKEKLVVVKIENKKTKSVGGQLSNNFVYARTNEFGIFKLDIDTVAPQVIPANITKGANMQAKNFIRITIKDNLTDIKSYNGYIDSSWALFEYDPKNDLLEYFFDTTRITTNMQHELELYVTDDMDNVETYYTTFFY